MTTPRRRWFRFAFSLRTLFVVVTVFGVWLGWQRHIVQERKAIIAELERKGWLFEQGGTQLEEAAPYLQLPIIRKWLGDDAYLDVKWFSDFDEIPASRIERAFPEAQLTVLEAADRELLTVDIGPRLVAFRDSLHKPAAERLPNTGTIFKTGLFEK